METKTDLLAALFKTLGAALMLIDEGLAFAEDGEAIKRSDGKMKILLNGTRAVCMVVSAFCRLGLNGDDKVNDSALIEQYRSEIIKQIGAIDGHIERKRTEIAAKRKAASGAAGKVGRPEGNEPLSAQLEGSGAPLSA